MTDSVGSISVSINGKDVNLLSLLREVRRAMQETDSMAARSGRGVGTSFAAGTTQAEGAALRFQAALARNQAAAGDTAGAITRLRGALSDVSATTPAVLQVQGQLTRYETQLAREAQQAERALRLQTQTQERMSQSANRGTQALGLLNQTAGAFGITLGAQAFVQGTADLTLLGAQADLTRHQFESLAQAAGTSGQALLDALKEASGGEISDLNLELSANRAILLGVADSAQEFSALMAIARDRAQSLGQTTTQAFNDLVTGLGRGSPEILDNLAIMISADEAYQAYAASIGKSTEELTKAEQKQAIINETIRQGTIALAQTGGATDSALGGLQRLQTAWENASAKIGESLSKNLEAATRGAIVVLNGITDALDRQAAAAQQLADTNTLVAQSANYADYVRQIQALSRESGNAFGNIYALSEAQYEQAKAALGGTTGGQQWAAAQNEAADAAQNATTATDTHANALQNDAAQSLLSAANTEQLTLAKSVLEQQARDAAAALIFAGDAGAVKAAQLAQSSSQIDQLTAAYYRLAAQSQIAAQLASNAIHIAAAVAPGLQGLVPGLDKVFGAIRTSGLTGKPVDIGLTPVTTPKVPRVGGSSRVGQAQREQEQLLKGQQKYSQESEDLEREHQQTLADIAADGAKKQQQALANLNQTRIRGRADFYRRLADTEDEGQRQRLSQQFEGIEQETQRIAQEQGGDVAAAYRDAAIKAVVYWFYTDLEAPNKMDSKPFFEFNMLEIKESAVEELKKFTKSVFDVTNILTTASELKYTREIKRLLQEQLQDPSDDFVKLFAAPIYPGRMTPTVREQFAQFTKQAFKQLVNDQINDRLKTALGAETTPTSEEPANTEAEPAPVPQASGVVTTDEELEAFHIVRAILRETVSVKRIVMRDVQSYCGILLDDNNRKPVVRLRFNTTQKALGFITGQTDGRNVQQEERVPIETLDDIYKHADRLKAVVARYDTKESKDKSAA
jgi:hypothetical protein